jgi:hypothetical protein
MKKLILSLFFASFGLLSCTEKQEINPIDGNSIKNLDTQSNIKKQGDQVGSVNDGSGG